MFKTYFLHVKGVDLFCIKGSLFFKSPACYLLNSQHLFI